MENFFSRYKNPLALMAILFIQVVALATQVKRPEGTKGSAVSGGTRLIRVWTVTAMSPFERALVSTGQFFRNNFRNYIYLHDARWQNRQLQEEVAQLKLEQVRLRQDAEQAKRLQALLGFTQHYVSQLLPAQVIGTSGSEQSHLIQIDKGARNAGIKVDMPVITPDGIVGKVKDVFPYTSQVLMINDRDSGAGVILEKSRLQGILRGSPSGELHVSDIMADERIDDGEEVVTSGGDRIYPKGLPVGTISHVSPDHDNDSFLAINVKPAADLNRLEEVLVVTKLAEEVPQTPTNSANVRAADILSERLPSIPKPDETKKGGGKAGAAAPSASPLPSPQPGTANQAKLPAASADLKKSQGNSDGAVTRKNNDKPAANPSVSPVAPAGNAGPAKVHPDVGQKKATNAAAQKNGAEPSGTPKAGAPVKKPKPQAAPSATPSPSETTSGDATPPKPATDAEKPPR
jgi:rod shape-determining protein MreC